MKISFRNSPPFLLAEKGGEFSNQTQKCYIQRPAGWIQRYKPSFLTNQNAQFLYSPLEITSP